MTSQDRMREILRSDPKVWSQFTKQEEYSPKGLDEYGRFPAAASMYAPLEPRVSQYLVEKGLKVRYPQGQPFAVCLTHDIDLLKPHSFRNASIPGFVKSSLKRTSKKFETAWNFERILDLEKSYSAKSTFFFMALKSGDEDFNYRIDDVRDETAMILDRGWEIGLHGGHSASIDLKELQTEKARLERSIGRKVVGCRNHYLKIRIPSTWRLQVEAGFEYDSTLGYADSVGFRNGMCYPFTPFDASANEAIAMVEIPLAVMDGTLFDHMGLDADRAWTMTKGLMDTVERCGGVFTVLWHNTHMRGDMLEFYERILKYGRERGAWMASGQEIAEWWRTIPFGFG